MNTDDLDDYDGPVTVMGLFSVTSSEQDQLVDAINETAEVMRRQPGFLKSAVFASLDGTRVVNSSQWESVASLKAAREVPEGIKLAQRMFELATPDPTLCVLRSEHFPPS